MMTSSDNIIFKEEEGNNYELSSSMDVLDYIEGIKNQFNEILNLCKLEKLKIAFNNLVKLETLFTSISTNTNINRNAELVQLINEIQSEERILKLRQEAIEIQDLLNVLSLDYKSQGWQSIHNTDGIHSMYKEHGSGIHSVRIEGIIDQPIFNVCAVINESDLYSTWIPRMTDSRVLGENRFSKFIYCKANCPWPVADRDVALYGYGVDMLDEENQVVVVSRSIKDIDLIGSNSNIKIPIPDKNVVRAKSEISGFLMKPINENSTFVQVVSLTDPNMALLPNWLLNFVTTQFCHYLFVMLRKQSEKLSPEHIHRINTNPIYQDIKEKSDNYFKKQKLLQEQQQLNDNNINNDNKIE